MECVKGDWHSERNEKVRAGERERGENVLRGDW